MPQLALALFLACVPLALRAGAEDAPARFDPQVIAVEFGAFCQRETVGEVPALDTEAKKVELLADAPEIRWPGALVPALPGVSFGVRTQTAGERVFSPVLIELEHPPFEGSGTTRQSYVTTLGGEGASINAYSFDTAEELVTGSWIFRAWHNGQALYEVRFEVVPPDLLPEVGAGCGPPVMS